MEPKPMTMWRGRYGVHSNRMEDTDEAVAVTPRADFDALVKERDEAVRLATKAGVCELGAHNPNVASYCREWEGRERAATARADKAEALLREARGWLAALLKIGADKPAVDALLARIDALLEGKA